MLCHRTYTARKNTNFYHERKATVSAIKDTWTLCFMFKEKRMQVFALVTCHKPNASNFIITREFSFLNHYYYYYYYGLLFMITCLQIFMSKQKQTLLELLLMIVTIPFLWDIKNNLHKRDNNIWLSVTIFICNKVANITCIQRWPQTCFKQLFNSALVFKFILGIEGRYLSQLRTQILIITGVLPTFRKLVCIITLNSPR